MSLTISTQSTPALVQPGMDTIGRRATARYLTRSQSLKGVSVRTWHVFAVEAGHEHTRANLVHFGATGILPTDPGVGATDTHMSDIHAGLAVLSEACPRRLRQTFSGLVDQRHHELGVAEGRVADDHVVGQNVGPFPGRLLTNHFQEA
jgi:hypothetical protein